MIANIRYPTWDFGEIQEDWNELWDQIGWRTAKRQVRRIVRLLAIKKVMANGIWMRWTATRRDHQEDGS